MSGRPSVPKSGTVIIAASEESRSRDRMDNISETKRKLSHTAIDNTIKN